MTSDKRMQTKLFFSTLGALLLSGCFLSNAKSIQDGPPKTYRDVSQVKEPTPHYLPKSRYGNPAKYHVNGKTYYVRSTAAGYNERGIASWYGSKFSHKLTSTRDVYDPYKMTAASPVLPIPCYARVTNLENGRSVIVKINDRGPFAPNRIIDLSYAAAIKLGYERQGTALVDVRTIDTQRPGTLPAAPHLAHPQIYLQVGAFHALAHADDLKSQMAFITHKSTRIETSRSSPPLYRVQIGPLKGVGEADKVQALVLKTGIGHPFTIIR